MLGTVLLNGWTVTVSVAVIVGGGVMVTDGVGPVGVGVNVAVGGMYAGV